MREGKGREGKGREAKAKGSEGKGREGTRSGAKGAKGSEKKLEEGSRRLTKRFMVRKAASFWMIPRNLKEKFFLGSSTWRSHRAFNGMHLAI